MIIFWAITIFTVIAIGINIKRKAYSEIFCFSILFVLLLTTGGLLSDFVVWKKCDKEIILTHTEEIYSRDNSKGESNYIVPRKEDLDTRYYYYIKDNDVIVPSDEYLTDNFIRYTKEEPRLETLEAKGNQQYLKRWSIFHYLGFIKCEKTIYVLYIPEGAISDELYLEMNKQNTRLTGVRSDLIK